MPRKNRLPPKWTYETLPNGKRKRKEVNPNWNPSQSTQALGEKPIQTKPLEIAATILGEAPREEHKPTRTEKEYENFLRETLGIVSIGAAIMVCYLLSEPLELVEDLALLPEEVAEISGPLARVLAKSKISSEVRTRIVSSGDYVSLSVALSAYVLRILEVLRDKGHVNKEPTSPVQKTRYVNSNGSTPPGYPTNEAHSVTNLAQFGNYAIN